MPRRAAAATASVRLSTLSFVKMLFRWAFTVASLMNRRRPISAERVRPFRRNAAARRAKSPRRQCGCVQPRPVMSSVRCSWSMAA